MGHIVRTYSWDSKCLGHRKWTSLVICNLSREVRFKKENILILGLLSGPKE
ncbi:2412_t:CDS:1, partial [Funneliformis geosporum]